MTYIQHITRRAIIMAAEAIDHGIMLNVFQRRFGVGDAALDWFASYFAD